MKQKFLKGCEIKVDAEMPPSMFHFEKGFNGIINYTYSEAYGGDDIKSYCIIQLDENRNPINCISWYYESQLTLISDDIKKGLKIIDIYNLKTNNSGPKAILNYHKKVKQEFNNLES